jgi:hypothetical protein
MKNIKNDNYYETSDLAFASFLVASGHAYRARAPPRDKGNKKYRSGGG